MAELSHLIRASGALIWGKVANEIEIIYCFFVLHLLFSINCELVKLQPRSLKATSEIPQFYILPIIWVSFFSDYRFPLKNVDLSQPKRSNCWDVFPCLMESGKILFDSPSTLPSSFQALNFLVLVGQQREAILLPHRCSTQGAGMKNSAYGPEVPSGFAVNKHGNVHRFLKIQGTQNYTTFRLFKNEFWVS